MKIITIDYPPDSEECIIEISGHTLQETERLKAELVGATGTVVSENHTCGYAPPEQVKAQVKQRSG
jgi:hypothetical protein